MVAPDDTCEAHPRTEGGEVGREVTCAPLGLLLHGHLHERDRSFPGKSPNVPIGPHVEPRVLEHEHLHACHALEALGQVALQGGAPGGRLTAVLLGDVATKAPAADNLLERAQITADLCPGRTHRRARTPPRRCHQRASTDHHSLAPPAGHLPARAACQSTVFVSPSCTYRVGRESLVRFTNDDTEASVVRNVSGPESFTFDAAGNVTTIDVSGVSLGWQTEGSDLTGTMGATLYVSHGPFHYNGDLQLVSYSGRTYKNICNVLE